MRLRHLARTAAALSVVLGLMSAPAAAATRVAPLSGALYVGTATEDGTSSAVSVRVGPGGTSLVSLLGGSFQGDLCTETTPLFAGPGGIDPVTVSLDSSGRFLGSQVTAAADGARLGSTLHGTFAADAKTAQGILTYSDAPVSGATPCTVTATLALHLAPPTATGKITPPRPHTTYQVITHQGWAGTVLTDKKGDRASVVQVSAWDICHYIAVPAAHFLYPEQVRLSAAIAHGRFVTHVAYSGGSGVVDATVTGEFLGSTHGLAGALHIRRTGSSAGNAFSCDTARVLFTAP